MRRWPRSSVRSSALWASAVASENASGSCRRGAGLEAERLVEQRRGRQRPPVRPSLRGIRRLGVCAVLQRPHNHLGICDCRDQNAVASNEVRSEHLNRSLVMGVRRVEERDDDVRVERALTCSARSRYLELRLAAGHPVRVMLARAWTPSLRRRDRRAIVRTAVDVRTALREPHDYWFLSDREAPERCPRPHRRLIRLSISA